MRKLLIIFIFLWFSGEPLAQPIRQQGPVGPTGPTPQYTEPPPLQFNPVRPSVIPTPMSWQYFYEHEAQRLHMRTPLPTVTPTITPSPTLVPTASRTPFVMARPSPHPRHKRPSPIPTPQALNPFSGER
jgi:hypothetical protein